jgi:hypothetical protein
VLLCLYSVSVVNGHAVTIECGAALLPTAAAAVVGSLRVSLTVQPASEPVPL